MFEHLHQFDHLKSNNKSVSHHELVLIDTLSKTYKLISQYKFKDCRFKTVLRFDLFRPR